MNDTLTKYCNPWRTCKQRVNLTAGLQESIQKFLNFQWSFYLLHLIVYWALFIQHPALYCLWFASQTIQWHIPCIPEQCIHTALRQRGLEERDSLCSLEIGVEYLRISQTRWIRKVGAQDNSNEVFTEQLTAWLTSFMAAAQSLLCSSEAALSSCQINMASISLSACGVCVCVCVCVGTCIMQWQLSAWWVCITHCRQCVLWPCRWQYSLPVLLSWHLCIREPHSHTTYRGRALTTRSIPSPPASCSRAFSLSCMATINQ